MSGSRGGVYISVDRGGGFFSNAGVALGYGGSSLSVARLRTNRRVAFCFFGGGMLSARITVRGLGVIAPWPLKVE